MSRVALGDDASTPIDFGLPTFSVDPNLLAVGGGILFLIWIARGTKRRVSRYSRKRRQRRELRESLKAQLRAL